MPDTPEKLPLTSLNIAAERREQLKTAFPEVFRDGDRIDFEALRRSLGDWVEPLRERFGLSWPGKAEAMRVIQSPSVGALLPQREESVRFDETENLIIEGDNLEVLKLLQKSYYNKIKMIYIDPPYNTGKEFIYPDNYQEGLEEYLRYSGQVDAEGRKYSANSEREGRYHSKWLSMMYPRLYLARNLLTDDGVIFVSIDDNEEPRLRMVMDEIFGEENFVAQFVWSAGRKNDAKLVSISHEYILSYAKDQMLLNENNTVWRQKKKGLDDIYDFFRDSKKKYENDYEKMTQALRRWYKDIPASHPAKAHKHYNNVDDKGIYFAADISWPGGGGPKYTVLHPKTQKPVTIPSRGWMTNDPEKMERWIKEGRVHFGDDESSVPCIKAYLQDKEFQVPYSVFYQDGRSATKRLRSLLDDDVFEHPKDETVLLELIQFTSNDNDIILDFFAGSGTTAHAVLDLNKQDNGNRKFILVQLPEPTESAQYPTIAEITRERVRRVIQKMDAEDEAVAQKASQGSLLEGDAPTATAPALRGFRSYKLSTSNFKVWDGETLAAKARIAKEEAEARGEETSSVPSLIHEQLSLLADHVLKGRNKEDMLAELLLKTGWPLTEPVERLTMGGNEVFAIQGRMVLFCLDDAISLACIEEMASTRPLQIICLDKGFQGNDQLKVNAVQTVKAYNRNEETDIVFRTV